MINHPEAPVAPVEAYEPPYYVAVFTSVRTQDQSGYSETSARMEDLVKDVPGFLGMDHAQTPGGLSITVGYFRDADALTQWRSNAEHRAAQKRGRCSALLRHCVRASASRKYPTVMDSPPGVCAWSIPRNPGTSLTRSSMRAL